VGIQRQEHPARMNAAKTNIKEIAVARFLLGPELHDLFSQLL
jgi:hypothetical protein